VAEVGARGDASGDRRSLKYVFGIKNGGVSEASLKWKEAQQPKKKILLAGRAKFAGQRGGWTLKFSEKYLANPPVH